MGWIIFLGSPLWAPLVAAIPLRVVDVRRLVQICNVAIGVQVGLTLTTWLLLIVGPRRQNWNGRAGETCPDLDGVFSDVLWAIAFSSLAVGAVALSSAVLSVLRRGARGERILAGLGASALSFAIFIPLIGAVFCGWD